MCACVAMLTVALGFKALSTPMSGDPLHAFVDDESLIEEHVQRSARFGGDTGKLLIAVTEEGDSLFSPETLNRIRAAAHELRSHPEIWSVDCLPDAFRNPVATRRLSAVKSRGGPW